MYVLCMYTYNVCQFGSGSSSPQFLMIPECTMAPAFWGRLFHFVQSHSQCLAIASQMFQGQSMQVGTLGGAR